MEPSSNSPSSPRALGDGGDVLLTHPESAGKAVGVGRWFVFFAVWMAGLAVLVRLNAGAEPGGEFAFRWRLLLCLLIYFSLACTFIPLPTTPVVVWAATADLGVAHLPRVFKDFLAQALGAAPAAGGLPLAQGVWARTLLIAAVCAAGTLVANLNDYHIWTLVLRQHKVAAIRETRLYRAAVRWFSKSAWFTLVGFTFIPIPIDVIRLLAITFRYPRWRFATASYVGRFFRYGILAWMVAALDTQPAAQWWLVIGVTVLAVGAGLTYAAAKALRMMRGKK